MSLSPLHVTSLEPSPGRSSEEISPVFIQNTVVLLKLMHILGIFYLHFFPNINLLEGKWNLSGFDSFTLILLVLFYKHQPTSK